MVEKPRQIGDPAEWGLPHGQEDMNRAVKREQSYIVAFAVLTIVAWQTAIGTFALMPFTLLATWFHEMAHGLTALLLGANFERLVIYANGSGFAEYTGRMGGVFQAVTAAAGLLGPSIAGSLMIVASRSRRATRAVLLILGVALLATTLIWVRSVAGWVVLPLFAAIALGVALRGSPKWQRIAVEFLGVQGAVSVWQDLGYLFSDGAVVGGHYVPSDTGVIADALLLPHWVWGGLITAAILTMVWSALRYASRN